MNQSYNLPSFEVTFSGLYSGTLDLINQPCQPDARKQQQAFQGMSGQTLDTPFPIYNSQSDIHNNEAGIFKSLHEYDIVPLTGFDPENPFGSVIHEIPKSVLDEYVPQDSDDELINDEISSIPNFPFTQQVCLLDSVPGPIPARHSNPDDQLTHLPAVLFNRQDLPPVTLVNPVNLNQATSDEQMTLAEEIADSLFAERQRERRQNPENRKMINQRAREWYSEIMQDPEKRKLRNQRARERYRERMQDPEKRKLRKQRDRERYEKVMQDPEKRKLNTQRERERRQAPEKRNLDNQRQRVRYHERMKDPIQRKLLNQRQKERMKDPEKRKLKNQRQRERMQDPEIRKLQNQRVRERMQDPENRKLKYQRERERRQDPEKRKLLNQRRRELYSERMQDPEKRKLRNQRARERYRKVMQAPEKREKPCQVLNLECVQIQRPDPCFQAMNFYPAGKSNEDVNPLSGADQK